MSSTDLSGPSLLVGRYRLVERLGAGGMSVVWRGFDEVLGRQVAVKVLPPSVSADPSFRRRLRAEAQAAARLSHPHITNVYDYGEAVTSDGDPVPFVVMELVDGESLAGLLSRMPQLSWQVAVRICAQVSAALAAAHARGIVHRDVTPANVMLTSSGAKVVDFGISALIGENDIDPDGSLLGTPAYLAPERLEGGQVSPASDVYAVGLLIYRAIIGQLPWDVGTTTALLRAHQYTEPEPLPPVEGMPGAVNTLVGRCLEKNPADRPPSSELAIVLAEISATAPISHASSMTDYGQDTTILPPRAEIGRVSREMARAASPGPVSAGPVSAGPVSAGPVAASPVSAVPAGIPAGSVWSGLMAVEGAADDAVPPPSARRPADDESPPPGPHAGTAIGSGSPRNSRFGAQRTAGQGDAGQAASGRPEAAESWREHQPRRGFVPPVARPAVPAGASSGQPSWPAVDMSNNSGTEHPAARIRPPAGSVRPQQHDPRQFVPAQRPGEAAGAGHGPAAAMGSAPGPAGRRRTAVGGRRLSLVVGAVLTAGALAYGVTTYQDPAGTDAQAAPQGGVLPDGRRCVVTYGITSHSGTSFVAAMTVTNRSSAKLADWKLRFLLRGDQTMTGIGGAKLKQQGRDVEISSRDAIAPHRTVVLALTGAYRTSNLVPVDFDLADVPCEVYVSPTPGEAPKQVQRTPDGQLRLVAQAPGTPVPGLSSGPTGYVPVGSGVDGVDVDGGSDPVVPPIIPVTTAEPETTGSPATTTSGSPGTSSSSSAEPSGSLNSDGPKPSPPDPVAGTDPSTSSSSPSPSASSSSPSPDPTTEAPGPPAGPPGGVPTFGHE